MILCFDVIPAEYSFAQNLYCLILYIITVFSTYKYNVSDKRWNLRRTDILLMTVMGILIYSLTNFINHDYFSYYEIVKSFATKGWAHTHLEDAHIAIIKFWDGNYLLYRFTVWGGALWLYCLGAKCLKLSIRHSVFVLAACYINIFSYGRITIAMALLFTGYIFCINNKNIIFRLFGLLLILSSTLFHKSIVIAILMVLIMPYVPFNKKTLKVAIIIFPVIVILAKSAYEYVLLSGFGLEADTLSRAQMYFEKTSASKSLFGRIRDFFDYCPFYIPLIVCLKAMVTKPELKLPEYKLLKIATGLIILGTCFFFFGLGNEIMAYRIIYMSMLPLALTMVGLYTHNVMTFRQFKICLWFGIAGVSYDLLYGVYSQL